MISAAGPMGRTLAETASPCQAKIAETAIALFAETAKTSPMPVEWVAAGLKKPGKSKKGLAAAMRLDPGVITRLLKGERRLKADEVPIVERYLGISSHAGEQSRAFDAEIDDAYAGVPVFDVRISAGDGAIASETAPKHYLMFRREWLQDLSRSPAGLVVLQVTGDSMWETLHDGDHALVDPAQVNPSREGLYVLRLDDALVVKRISMHPVTKKLTIKSDNPAYPTYAEVSPDDVSIFGRVVWVGRRL